MVGVGGEMRMGGMCAGFLYGWRIDGGVIRLGD